MTLWQTVPDLPSTLKKQVQDFTVGEDYKLDLKLIPYDVKASIAHAQALKNTGILSEKELKKLTQALEKILELHKKGKFIITPEQEDGHTAIEEFLIKTIGDTGKKIHTGRSRNDQVLVAMRLWERDKLDEILLMNKKFIQKIIHFAQKHEFVPMPGFTHTQAAMPCSIGMWAGSLAEMALQNQQELISFRKIINQSPLGSAAGFGTGFQIDREAVAQNLGFEKCLTLSLTSQNTRGKIEANFVSHLSYLSLTLAHFANDLVWFNSSQFKFFDVHKDLTTGSSIMPQKKNLDSAELLRASHHQILGYEQSLKSMTTNLISGYHRDLQLSKKPVMKAGELIEKMITIGSSLIENITPNTKVLINAFDSDIFAADQANQLVLEGASFRDAYKQVKTNIEKIESPSENQIIENLKNKTHLGAPGNLGLEKLQSQLNTL